MSELPKLENLVIAQIPSTDNPNALLLNVNGLYPSEFAKTVESPEKILSKIGKNALRGGYLSIDRQLKRYNSSELNANVTHVLADPIDRSIANTNAGFYWSDEDFELEK